MTVPKSALVQEEERSPPPNERDDASNDAAAYGDLDCHRAGRSGAVFNLPVGFQGAEWRALGCSVQFVRSTPCPL